MDEDAAAITDLDVEVGMETGEEVVTTTGAGGASLELAVEQLSDSEQLDSESDEFALVENALSSGLKPVVARCDEVLGEVDESVRISKISSEQRRALGRVEDTTKPTEIVNDFIKVEVEEHDVPGNGRHLPDEDIDYFRRYKTTAQERKSRIHSPATKSTPSEKDQPSRSAGLTAARRSTAVRGRGRPAKVGRGRGRGGGSRFIQATRSPSASVGDEAGDTRPSVSSKPGGSQAEKIHILSLISKNIIATIIKDKLTLEWINDSDGQRPSTDDLTFMELVKIKELLVAQIEAASGGTDETRLARLRNARRQAITWVEVRLRAEAAVEPSTHGKSGKSKFDALVQRAAADQRRSAAPSQTILGGTAVGRPLAPTSSPLSARPSMASGGGSSSDPDYDPRSDTATGAASGVARRGRGAGVTRKDLLHHHEMVRKSSVHRDIILLQSKLRDLQNVEVELKRAVDYFRQEGNKDTEKLSRLKKENENLQAQLTKMENSLLVNAPKTLLNLLDKDKRKTLTQSDEAVLECSELLTEVGRDNYAFIISQGIPLLSAKELEEKSRGGTAAWRAGEPQAEAPTAVRGKKRKRARGRSDAAAPATGAAVDAAVQEAVVGNVEGSEQISLPQEVLDQVMSGQGYLVDEHGERLEIRVMPE